MHQDNQYQPTISREDIEHTIKQNEVFITRADKLQRLLDNEDFKELITEGFLKKFALEQVYALANPQLQDDKFQAKIQKHLQGIASFNDYLEEILANGQVAKEDLPAAKAELDSFEEAVANGEIVE